MNGGNMFIPTYSEAEILTEILKGSPEFKNYYQTERTKIKTEVSWSLDNSLPVGINACVTRYQDGKRIIRLRQIPAPLNNAMSVAHELEHLRLDEEGFPLLTASPAYEFMAASLSGMVHDVLIDTKLTSFGFDLKSKYLKEAEESRRQLMPVSKTPTDKMDRVAWIINYVSTLLDYESVRSKGLVENNEFNDWFQKKYPDIVRDAQKMIETVAKIGFDTPDKQNRLFSTLIDLYSLNGLFSIRNFA